MPQVKQSSMFSINSFQLYRYEMIQELIEIRKHLKNLWITS